MSSTDHNEIMRELGGIRSDIKSIDSHLAELNSKVATNVEDIQELKRDEAVAEYRRQNYQETQEARSKWVDFGLKGLLSVIGIIILLAMLSALEGVDLVSAIM